ncbi:MAG: HlyD family efflux transporter periplasmic adaptor subunit [Shimia sp.]
MASAPSLPGDLRRTLRRTLMILVVAGAGVLSWAMLAQVSTTLQVPGTLEFPVASHEVQHLRGGQVSRMHVRMHERVSAGAPLIDLDASVALESLRADQALREVVGAELAELERRLHDTTEHAALPFVSLKFTAEDEQHAAELHEIGVQIEGQGLTREALAVEMAAAQELETLTQARLDRARTLLEKGLSTQDALASAQEAWLAASTARHALVSRDQELASAIAAAKDRRDALIAYRRSSLSERLVAARKDILQIEARIGRSKQDIAAATIMAPISGVITALPVDTADMVVSPGQTVATVAQVGDEMVLKLRIPPLHVDQVHVGQTGKLTISALPMRDAADIRVELTDVAPEPVRDPEGQTLYYEGRARVDQADLNMASDQLRPGATLTAGLPITVALEGDRTTLWQFLTKPFNGLLARAFEE